MEKYYINIDKKQCYSSNSKDALLTERKITEAALR